MGNKCLLWVHNNGYIFASLNLHDIFIQKSGRLKLKLDPFEIKRSVDNKLADARQKQVWDIRLIGLVLLNCMIGEIFNDDQIDQAMEVLEFCLDMKRSAKGLSKATINSFLNKYPHLIIWIKKIDLPTFENVYRIINGDVTRAEDLLSIELFPLSAGFLVTNDITLHELVITTNNMDKNMLSNVNDNQRGITTRFSSLLVKKLANVLIGVFGRIIERWNTEEKAVYVLSWLQINDQSKFIVEISHMLGISRRSVLSFFRKMIAKYKIDEKLREIKKKYECSIIHK